MSPHLPNVIQWHIVDKIIEYQGGIEIMHQFLDNLLVYRREEAVLLFEHNDIYTSGVMKLNNSEILDRNIQIIESQRGGRLTYHGPGQRIIYPVLDLQHFNKDIKKYISFLQEWIINTLQNFDIKCYSDNLGVGVWTDKDNIPHKIASIGIRIKKWLACHGIAVNISTNLHHFDKIVPCGISSNKVTSLKDLGKNIAMKDFDIELKREFNKLYHRLQCK